MPINLDLYDFEDFILSNLIDLTVYTLLFFLYCCCCWWWPDLSLWGGQLVDLLVGTEPADNNDIMLEVSAGVGGQEAMLFTGEIFDMYANYAGFKGWTFDTVDHEKSDQGMW